MINWTQIQEGEKQRGKISNLADITPEKLSDSKHVIESDQELLLVEHPQVELIIWHRNLGHLTFSNINILSLLGIIPKRTANENVPKRKGCIYRTMTKFPWHAKTKQEKSIQLITASGQCVSMDQLE